MSIQELASHRFSSRTRYMHLLQIRVQSNQKWIAFLLQRVKSRNDRFHSARGFNDNFDNTNHVRG